MNWKAKMGRGNLARETMKIERLADGFQIECPKGSHVLVTFRTSPDHPHGFGGCVLEEDAEGNCVIADFHGNHAGGVVCHESQFFDPNEKDG